MLCPPNHDVLQHFHFEWNKVNIPPKRFSEWIKVSHLFPPSFLTVVVMNGRRKQKAYFDAANHMWIANSENYWAKEIILKKVNMWKQIENESFEYQMKHFLEYRLKEKCS